MRKAIYGSLLLLAAAMCCVPAVADDNVDISVHGEVRARYEYLENNTDFTDTDGSANSDDFDIWPYRVRVGVTGDFGDNVSAHVEIQNFGNFGDGLPYIQPGADDPVDQGFWAFNLGNETELYQGYIEVKEVGGSSFSFRIGRQEHTLGNELHMGDLDFYNGMTFDGARGMFDWDSWGLDLFYYNVGERNVLPGSIVAASGVNGGSDDAIFWGITADFSFGNEQRLEPYILYYKEGNELGNPTTLRPKHNTLTIGALWDRPALDDELLDWALEVAMQSGDLCPTVACTSEADISSWIAEGWLGFNFGNHRFHLGALIQSDGDDPDDVESFIPLFPDLHSNNRLGDSDLIANLSLSSPFGFNSGSPNTFHNITNYNLGWNWDNGPHEFWITYHMFEQTENFGSSNDELGDEWNVGYNFDYTGHLNFEVAMAQFSPGDFFENHPLGPFEDDALRFWGQARLRF